MYNIVRFFISFPSPQNTMALKIYNIKINHETNTENGQKKEKKINYNIANQMYIITLLLFFIEMLQYIWLWSGHMIIKEMFHIPMKLKYELACASMTTSDVNNQWRSNFQLQII